MSDVIAGSSFAVTSKYVNASKGFTKSQKLIAYVEGFEDVNFWNKIFKKQNIDIKVIPYALKGKANGKGTIISAIRNGDIILGSSLVVALDSDYDYLLDRNTDIFQSDCVFQTYTYAIENLIWHPDHLDEVCQEASNDTQYAPNGIIKNAVIDWSAAVYPEFLKFLKEGACDDNCLNSIISLLKSEDCTFDFDNVKFPEFKDQEFLDKMFNKGLSEKSVHLFVRGHDFEEKIDPLCQSFVERVFYEVKKDIEKNHQNQTIGQLIKEYRNSRQLPRQVAKGKEIKCGFALPKIVNDILTFHKNYISGQKPVAFSQISAT
ncbi:DUF4435 domain-containing protein [Vibrio parahaemolyticus]|uniref:DUF4435 domain-containing protein n=1 Tax=Vibrio parahaemolyticus TaxID=670 RepID=UPI002360A192|nr:DUF4435 domain-containing protein [Vibrio parahaemolyticus]